MAGTMSSTMEYRQLLKGLDRQNRPSPPPPPPANAPPLRSRGRARAMYPGNSRARSMEQLGSIDEIVMDSDFSDSAVSPPLPSPKRHRRPSSPRNFSRPDPNNFPLKLSRDQEKVTATNNAISKMPVRGGKQSPGQPPQSGIQAMSAFYGGDPLPDEPSFDDDLDSEEDGPYRGPRRPSVYSNQRYEKRPSSAKGATTSPRSPILTPAKSAWERSNGANGYDNSRSRSRATSRMSDETIKPRPLSAAAINQTAPLPLKGARNHTTRSPTNNCNFDEHDYAQRGNPQLSDQQRILKRISFDQHSEHYEPSSYVDLPIGINNLKTGPTNNPRQNKADKDLPNNTSHLRPTRPSAKSSNTSTSKSSSHRSNSSSSARKSDSERPPCWAGSDFDFVSVLTEKEIAKLKKKGINPALYAEMQAAKREGQEGGSKGRKWIGPLVGNTYSG